MTDVWVRPLVCRHRDDRGQWVDTPEKKLFIGWLFARRAENRFDPVTFEVDPDGEFTHVKVWVCYNSTEIIGFVPVTVALQLESLAFKPETPPVLEARALIAMQHHLVFEANKQKISDVFFVTQDANVLDIAKRHGWKSVDVPMLNLHVADLEPTDGRP